MEEMAKFIQTYGLISFLVMVIFALIYVFKLFLSMADKFNGVIEKVYPTLTLLEVRLKEDTEVKEELVKLIEWCKRKG